MLKHVNLFRRSQAISGQTVEEEVGTNLPFGKWLMFRVVLWVQTVGACVGEGGPIYLKACLVVHEVSLQEKEIVWGFHQVTRSLK